MSGNTFENPKPGTYAAAVIGIIDRGRILNPHRNQVEHSFLVRLVLTSKKQRNSQGSPFVVTAWYNDWQLRRLLCTIGLDAEQTIPENLQSLTYGKGVTLTYGTTPKSDKIKVTNIAQAMDDVDYQIPEKIVPWYFDLRAPDWDWFQGLSEKMRALLLRGADVSTAYQYYLQQFATVKTPPPVASSLPASPVVPTQSTTIPSTVVTSGPTDNDEIPF